MFMVYHDTANRAVMERLNIAPLKRIAQQSGVQTALQFLVKYTTGRFNRLVPILNSESTQFDIQFETIISARLEKDARWHGHDYASYLNFVINLQKARFEDFFHHLVMPLIHRNCKRINAHHGHLSKIVCEILQ